MDSPSEIKIVPLPRKVAEKAQRIHEQSQPLPDNLTPQLSLGEAVQHLEEQKATLHYPFMKERFPHMDIAALEQYYDDQIALLKGKAPLNLPYDHVMQLYNVAQKAVNEYAEHLVQHTGDQGK